MSKRFRFLFTLSLIIIGGIFLYPTISWYFFISESDKELAAASRQQIREYAQGEAREVLLELRELVAQNGSMPLPEEYDYLLPYARENVRLSGGDMPSEWSVIEFLAAFRSEREAFGVIETHQRDRVTGLKDMKTRIVELGLDLSGGISVTLEADAESLAERLGQAPSATQLDEAVDLAVEVLRNRIDRFGVTEPVIRRQEGGRIGIEIPGDDDRERVNAFLMGSGSLNFHIVDDEVTESLIQEQQQTPGWDPDIDGIPEFVPAGVEVVPYMTRDAYGIDQLVRYIAIREDVREHGLPGEYITEAQVGRDQLTNRPTVNFVLDRQGADMFARLTRDNVGRSMAIVMDGRVRAYATIQEEIPTGQVRISGFDQEQARDIATVLRTAALPIDLVILNQQVVGASLGEATIEAGLKAVMIGLVLVLVFMLLYYHGAGLIANIALSLNLFFLVAVLSAFNLTLTLTSIAGIILTVGMAVDANVIIFERIKEEYRLGKSAKASVKAGYEKAFSTIMDANITTFIAAVFLSQLGTGPIQGFAVTLAVGIVCSMFSALFISRLAFDFVVDVLKSSKLSIGWGVSA